MGLEKGEYSLFKVLNRDVIKPAINYPYAIGGLSFIRNQEFSNFRRCIKDSEGSYVSRIRAFSVS